MLSSFSLWIVLCSIAPVFMIGESMLTSRKWSYSYLKSSWASWGATNTFTGHKNQGSNDHFPQPAIMAVEKPCHFDTNTFSVSSLLLLYNHYHSILRCVWAHSIQWAICTGSPLGIRSIRSKFIHYLNKEKTLRKATHTTVVDLQHKYQHTPLWGCPLFCVFCIFASFGYKYLGSFHFLGSFGSLCVRVFYFFCLLCL